MPTGASLTIHPGINLCFSKLLLSQNCNVVLADLAFRPEARDLVDRHSANRAPEPCAVFVKTDVTQG